jgi:starch synthase
LGLSSNGILRINIVTSGRFHVLDLARELAALGHDIRFYSYLSRRRTRAFGLPQNSHRSVFRLALPLVALSRWGPKALRNRAGRWEREIVDRIAARCMEPCDVFIGMSGLAVASAKAARARFGAKVFLERGSRHILSQKAILDELRDGASTVPNADVERELAGYELADVVVVPSRHAERSFIDYGVAPQRLFRNPYGVDLALFQPTERTPNPIRQVLMIGAWSLRKGCDVLWEACRSANAWRLLHVGPVDDAPLPQSVHFTHVPPVEQRRLADYFRQADVFALASREEGLSLVQAQALACGVPLVCTDRTGGEDLREMLEDPRWVTVVASGDVAALREGIGHALGIASEQSGVRDILGAARTRFSWTAYGARYQERLQTAGRRLTE